MNESKLSLFRAHFSISGNDLSNWSDTNFYQVFHSYFPSFTILLHMYMGIFYAIGCVKIILGTEQINILRGPISQFSKKKTISICPKFFLDNFYTSINVNSSMLLMLTSLMHNPKKSK